MLSYPRPLSRPAAWQWSEPAWKGLGAETKIQQNLTPHERIECPKLSHQFWRNLLDPWLTCFLCRAAMGLPCGSDDSGKNKQEQQSDPIDDSSVKKAVTQRTAAKASKSTGWVGTLPSRLGSNQSPLQLLVPRSPRRIFGMDV